MRGWKASPWKRNVVLVDPFSAGHHIGYAVTLAEGLRSRGISVTFVTWKSVGVHDAVSRQCSWLRVVTPASKATRSGVGPLHQLWRSYRCWRTAAREAERIDASVVHWLYVDRQELALLAASRWRDPYGVVTLFWPYFATDGPAKGWLKAMYHVLNRAALRSLLLRRRVAWLAVHSERCKALAEREIGSAALGRIVVVPDPSAPTSESPRDAARRELRVRGSDTMLLFFGQLRADKGPDLLLEALTQLRRLPGWSAYFAGEPGMFGAADFVARVRSAGLEDKIAGTISYVSDELMATCFSAADIVVLPYRSTFLGTSGVLQTSAATHRPVVATDVGDVGQAVRDYGLGIVVEPDSAEALARGLASAIADVEGLRVQVEPACVRYVRDHSPDRFVDGMLDVYVRLSGHPERDAHS